MGLYYPDGHFEDDAEIKRKLYLEGDHPEPDFISSSSLPKNFQQYSAEWRQKQNNRTETYQDRGEVQLFDTSLVTFQSDLHIGGEETDYARIEQEAEVIVNTPNSYVVLMGDLIDNFSFNPPTHETLDVVPEQLRFARELIKYYSDNKKLLAIWAGNHDYWTMRQGFDIYEYLMEGTKAYKFFGVSYLDINVCDQQYKVCGSHQFAGNSMYNKAHPQNRAIRFGGAWGADIVVSGHWHEKAIAQQTFDQYGGESFTATMIALGTYKLRDGYTRNKAFAKRDMNSAYGVSVEMSKDRKSYLPYYDVIEAHRKFKG